MTSRPYVFALLLAACGASAGFEQPAPRVPSSQPPIVNDADVERAFELQAQLPKPYRLGVLFRDPPATPEKRA